MKDDDSLRSRRQKAALAEALAGVVGSLVALWAFYPMDVIKTNLQASTSAVSLFRGLEIKTLHTAASSFCYFYIHSCLVSMCDAEQQQRQRRQLPTAAKLALAAVAAMMNTCLTLPLDVIASRHQTSDPRALSSQSNNNNKDDDDDVCAVPSPGPNLASLWKGLVPSLLLCTNPAIHYTVFDVLKARQFHRTHQPLSMLGAFLLGLIAKFTATISTYPLIRAKLMLMVTSSRKNPTMLTCLRDEYNRGGVRAWYAGCNLQLLHTVLKSALMMMVRERITKTTHRLLVPATPAATTTGSASSSS